MEELLSDLQNKPIILVILAAIAVTLALFYLFPVLLHLVPTSVVKEETKKTHRRSLFFGALFIVLILIALGAFFVIGVREKLEQSMKPPPVTYTYTPEATASVEVKQVERTAISGQVTKVDVSKNLLSVKDSFDQKVYTVTVSKDTVVTKEGKKISLAKIELGDTVSAVASQNISKTKFKANMIEVLPELIPIGGQQ